MKRLALIILVFYPILTFSQTYNMPGGTINTCSGNFYDGGGSGGNYANSQNVTTTFCSNNGTCIQAVFSSFNLENSWDFLYVYDGPTIGSPLIGTYTGATSPGTITSSSGCLTFRFTSDGSVTSTGWAAALSCVPCPPPGYNMPGGTINTCSGGFYDGGGIGGNYANSQNVTTTFCSNSGNCVIVSFSSFNIENNFDYLYVYDGPTIGSPLIGTYTGTTSPGTVTSTTGCLTFRFTSDGIVTAPGWAATISCGTCGVPPPPSTTNCDGAIGVCTDASYNITPTGFGNQELNASNQGCLLANEHQTTWFGFSPSSTGTIALSISPTAGAVDYDFAIWGPYPPGSGCPVTGAPLRCSYSDDTAPTGMASGNVDVTEDWSGNSWVAPITIGAAQIGMVYYLVVDNWTGNSTPFQLDWSLSPSNMLDCTPPLPIELSNFTGYAENKINHLNWSTFSEINSDHFIIEKSSDGQSYHELGRVKSTGYSNTLLSYSTIDENPWPVTYYKLKQVDLDGNFEYFGPIVLTNNEISELSVTNIYPNPADHAFFIETYSKEEVQADLHIYDPFGKPMYLKGITIHGFQTFEIPSSDWPAGVYLVKIVNESQTFQYIHKIIIE